MPGRPCLRVEHFLDLVVAGLPGGPVLDTVVVTGRPEPWLVGAPLSAPVQQQLLGERGLYGAQVRAASSDDPDVLERLSGGPHPSVVRHLPYNRHLAARQAATLARRAADGRDAGLVQALMWGRDDFLDLLDDCPGMLDCVSARRSSEGARALARRILASDVDQVRRFYRGRWHGHAGIVARGALELAGGVYGNRAVEQPCRLAHGVGTVLSAQDDTAAPPGARWRAREGGDVGVYTYPLEGDLADLGDLPKAVGVALLPPGMQRRLLAETARDRDADDDELACLLHLRLEVLGHNWWGLLGEWSEPARRYAAAWCAARVDSPAVFSGLEALLPTWRGSLHELLAVCRALDR